MRGSLCCDPWTAWPVRPTYAFLWRNIADCQTAAALLTRPASNTHHATCCRDSWTTLTKVILHMRIHMYAPLYLMHIQYLLKIRDIQIRALQVFSPIQCVLMWLGWPDKWSLHVDIQIVRRIESHTFRQTRQVQTIYTFHIFLFVVCNHVNWTMKEQFSVWANQESM